MTETDERPQPVRQHTSHTTLPPRGILKNKPGSQDARLSHLKWDEPNLALNDLNRDSTMKITEPKTPFVRYNAETDEVMNIDAIPEFDLGRSSGPSDEDFSSSPPAQDQIIDGEDAHQVQVAQPSRTRRFSSTSSRRNSDSTERRQVLVQAPAGPSHTFGEVDEEADEEDLDPNTKAKHDAFVRARKGHYGNEAEAMKRARELAEKDESESEATAESDLPSEAASEISVKLNGN